MQSARNHGTGIPRVALTVLAFSLFSLCGSAVGSANQGSHLPPAAQEALKSRFGLTDAELESRVALERTALQQDQVLQDELGTSYAGSWIDEESSTLRVATTDPGMEPAIKAVGATPVVREHSLNELERTMELLNVDFSDRPGAGIASWHLDVQDNRVVITILPQKTAQAVDAIARTRVSLDRIKIEHTTERPIPLANIYGGSQYNDSSGALCSVGFAVSGGFVTAGHCGDEFDSVYTSGSSLMGEFEESDYPGDDMAFVATDPGYYPRPRLRTYVGSTIPVGGSTVAPIGAYVCRSGYSTEWQCGKIENRPASVNYGDGVVSGLTGTNACAYFGDSGGPFINSYSQGQGVTSGGSVAQCTTYFQPLNEILSEYNLSLSTTSGSPSGSAPQITSFTCPDHSASGGGSYFCSVQYSSSGQTSISWFVNGAFSSFNANNSSLNRNCFGTSSQTVKVVVANLYGRDVESATFDCPGDIFIP